MFKKKLTAFLTSIILLSAVFVGTASADTDLRIVGNGSHSDNSIRVNKEENLTVRQSNDTNITNNVSVDNNTGRNSASGNTGGDVRIRTGDATADVNITNKAGMNVANIGSGGEGEDTKIKIEGNGSWSDNSVRVSSESNLTVRQDNDTNIDNDVDIRNNTGHNRANGNTWGDVTIQTGNAEADVNISNEAAKNVLNVDGCCGGQDLSISIQGNGSGSDNSVSYNADKNIWVDQDNNTDFDNDVDVYNNTGHNLASSGWYDYDKKRYDHDKKYYDSYKKDYDFDKYDDKKYGRDYDKDKKYYPVVKYLGYDKDQKSYKKDDRDYRDKKFYPVYKKVVLYPVYTKDNDLDKKDYDRKDDGKKYSFAPYPKYKFVDYDRKNYCPYDKDGKYSYPWKKYYPYHGGNTGGDVQMRTGNATSNVNLHNAGSSNYLSFI